MPYSHKTSEYRDIKNEFDEALLWIVNQQKVKIADTSRLNKYRGDIDLITKSFHKKEIRKLLEQGMESDMVSAIFEARQIIDIWEGLKDYPYDQNLSGRLTRLVKGPHKTTEEKLDSRFARDFGYELWLASRFALGKYTIKFEPESDVCVLTPERLLLQCKRPEGKTDASLHRNLKKAFRQLEDNYASKAERGFVAVSINKIVRPDERLLYAKNMEGLKATLIKHLKVFADLTLHWWSKASSDNRTLGVIFSVELPCYIKDIEQLTVARQILFATVDTQIERDSAYFYRITGDLKKSIEGI
ncbi:MAG: hypothetical protein A3I31_00495 [Candidatus Colwellbacteria bacterium RIFCSPLOWO2_02_FULL_44_20b]|uniref:Uncharacterized protein n=1 Tax=Candidatus Colwellbacteria bacterium RIFCSPLOWO2_02_FULL_44_20b TaxID=1797691 RepID=A0A1G1Z7K5_9BACT|nr:MAG: hypothetical protein A3I31_00495 [Candidatus Colwellbacteria bacterium RIFCSPLOWO2_02_FULL_44_20b]